MRIEKFKLTTAQLAVGIAILTLGTKLLAFVRELVLANFFGAGTVTDAYVMAQSIPNILLAGLISAAAISYMPIFSRITESEGLREGNLFTSRLLNAMLIISVAAAVLGAIFARHLVSVFARGYDEPTAALTAWYLRPAFAMAIFNVLVYIFEAFLQYKEIFFPQIIFGYLQNISVIAFVVIAAKTDYHLLILGTLVGWVARGLGCLWTARRRGYRYSADFKFDAAVKEAVTLALPIFIGGSVNQINTFVDRALASDLRSGSVSALNYGNTIINSIVMLTVSILVIIVYPKLNKAFAAGDRERVGELAERGINILALISIPFSMGAMLYARPVIQLIYEHGAFDAAATDLTSSAFFYYAIGLSFITFNQLITKVFYSMHDTKTAVGCSVVAVAVNIVLNLILVRYMQHSGLALATSIAQALNAALLWYSFRRKHPDIELLSSKRKLLQVFIFSAISVGISYLCFRLLNDTIICSQMPSMLAALALAVLLYLLLLKIAKFSELSLIKDLFGQ
ncbi:MAG: murein biosynthesis integral membrane protein MurJ [Clostridiales bacterium]|nr:murein biosynthesis integral membrane protein MurJ [Clostridiales bacterium]